MARRRLKCLCVIRHAVMHRSHCKEDYGWIVLVEHSPSGQGKVT